MWRRKISTHFTALIAVSMLSTLIVGGLLAQEETPEVTPESTLTETPSPTPTEEPVMAAAVTIADMQPTEMIQGVGGTLTITGADFTGDNYSDSANLSVYILSEVERDAQVLLDSYQITPASALPGETVNVQALFVNTGNETASQVLVQLGTSNAILIAGSEGNSFAIGDMPPGASAAIIMPLVVANDASAGVQAQSFTISYMQDGSSRENSASISLNIEQVVEESPVLLLAAYDTGQDESLQSGQQFTFTMSIQNAGGADASNLLITAGCYAASCGDECGPSCVTRIGH